MQKQSDEHAPGKENKSKAPPKEESVPKFRSWIDIKKVPDPEDLNISTSLSEQEILDLQMEEELWGREDNDGNNPGFGNQSAKGVNDGIVALPPGWWSRNRIDKQNSEIKIFDELGSYATPLPRRVFVILTIFGCASLLGLVGWLVNFTVNSIGRSDAPPSSLSDIDESKEIVDVAALQAMVEKFANATSLEERLQYVRDPERVKALIESYHPEVGTGPVQSVKNYGIGGSGGLLVEEFLVTFKDGRMRKAAVVRTAEGFKVDWEAYSRQGDVEFATMMDGTEKEVEMRVVIGNSFYYNYEYNDESTWKAFDLNNGDWPHAITGYAKIGSDVVRDIQHFIEDSGSAAGCILKLKISASTGSKKQCEILELVESGWVKGQEQSLREISREKVRFPKATPGFMTPQTQQVPKP